MASLSCERTLPVPLYDSSEGSLLPPVPRDENGLAICSRLEDAEMEAGNRQLYNSALLPEDIVGTWGGLAGGASFNCGIPTLGSCDVDSQYQSDLTIDAVPMDFEEPAGSLRHSYFDFDGGGNANLYFRRVDTCRYFSEFEFVGTELTLSGVTQEGPNPMDTTEDPQCYVFRACYPDYIPGSGNGAYHYSNEIYVSPQQDGSLYVTYVSCYQPILPVEDGPGLISARFYLHPAEECPGGTSQRCEATCPAAENVFAKCVAECAERCEVVAFENNPHAGASMTTGAIAGIAVAIIGAVAVIGVAFTKSRKVLNGSGHVQLLGPTPEVAPKTEKAPEWIDQSSVQSFEVASV